MELVAALRKVTPAQQQHYIDAGYAVLDGLVAEADAKGFLENIKRCYNAGDMKPNKVQFLTAQNSSSAGPLEVTKPNIFEADMHDDAVRKKLPQFDDLFEKGVTPLTECLNDLFPTLKLSVEGGSKNIAVKLQVNKGGCFPWHYDNPSRPNKRKLTLALYLCEDWKLSDGGQLVLQPFLSPEVILPPIFNRIVLFSGETMAHRVLPSSSASTRYCFTIWFDSPHVNSDGDVNLRAKHLTEEFVPTLMNSPLQRSIARAVYDEEYRKSLEDCFLPERPQDLKLSLLIHTTYLKSLTQEPLRGFINMLRLRIGKAPL